MSVMSSGLDAVSELLELDDDDTVIATDTLTENSTAVPSLRSSSSGMSNLIRSFTQTSFANSVIPSFGRLEVSLADVCKMIRRVKSLQQANIAVVECYAQYSSIGVKHRYLLVQLLREGKDDVWLRLDRRKHPRTSALGFVFGASKSPAFDQASFSKSKDILIDFRPGKANHESTLLFKFQGSPKLIHLVGYLESIITQLKEYKLWPENCWMFCSLIQQFLRDHHHGYYALGNLNPAEVSVELRSRIEMTAPALPSPNEIRVWTPEFPGGWVTSVTFTPDGLWIVFGLMDTSVHIWSVETGMEKQRLEGHASYANTVAVSPDGRQIASGSMDNTVVLWSAARGEQIHRLTGHVGFIRSVAFSPDNKTLISGSADQTIRVWSTETGEDQVWFMSFDAQVMSVTFSPDGTTIAAGLANPHTSLWICSAETGDTMKHFQGHTNAVCSVAFSPDGLRIASGGDHTVRVWSVETGEMLRMMESHEGLVSSIAYSPDGTQIVSGSADSLIRLWAVETGELLRVFKGHRDGVTSVAFSPNGEQIVSGSDDHNVRLWSTVLHE